MSWRVLQGQKLRSKSLKHIHQEEDRLLEEIFKVVDQSKILSRIVVGIEFGPWTSWVVVCPTIQKNSVKRPSSPLLSSFKSTNLWWQSIPMPIGSLMLSSQFSKILSGMKEAHGFRDILDSPTDRKESGISITLKSLLQNIENMFYRHSARSGNKGVPWPTGRFNDKWVSATNVE